MAPNSSRPPPEQTHYYALTGGARTINVKFTPAPKPAYPTCVTGLRRDGRIPRQRRPRLVTAAMRRPATADVLVTSTSWAAADTQSGRYSQTAAEANAPAAAPLSSGFSTEYSRSFGYPQSRTDQRWVGMTTESWAKQDGCVYTSASMCRDSALDSPAATHAHCPAPLAE